MIGGMQATADVKQEVCLLTGQRLSACKPLNTFSYCRSNTDHNHIIASQMNQVEVVYEAGFCLPRLIVKEEAQEEVTEKV